MWSLILYLLFGIGQPSNAQLNARTPALQATDSSEADPGDNGGDAGTVRPPRK